MLDIHAPLQVTRIVTRPRGSWRWQDAYGLSTYESRRTRAGRLVWSCVARSRGKWSYPQLVRMGYGDVPIGSLHNRPVDPLHAMALALQP